MAKIVGTTDHLYVIEESHNQIDWLIVFIGKSIESVEAKYRQYKPESLAPFIRAVQFEREGVMLISEEPEQKKAL